MTDNYLFALYLLSKYVSFFALSNNYGYKVAKEKDKGTYKNFFCFAYREVISQDEIGAVQPIQLKGRLVVINRDRITEQIKNEYVEGNLLILDFSDIDYISAAGLSNIIKLKDEFNRDVIITGLN